MECSSLLQSWWVASAVGKEARKVTNGTCIHSLQSSLLKPKEENEGEKDFTHSGQGEIVSVDVWLWKWNSKASICFQNLHYSSTKFSFQSSDHFFRWKRVYGAVVLCYRNTDININTSASFFFCSRYIAICFFVGCALDHSPLRLPNTRTKLWSTKCVFWYMELSSTTASLLTEEAHNNLGIFCFTLLLLN